MRLLISLLLSLVCTRASFLNEYEAILPPIYDMENVKSCNERICEVSVDLLPLNPDSWVWKQLMEIKGDKTKFDRTKLYRVICADRGILNQDLEEQFSSRMLKQIKNLSLTASTQLIHCNNDLPQFDSSAYALIYFLVAWLLVVLAATGLEAMSWKLPKALVAFSLIHNYNQLVKDVDSVHYKRLKAFQALRTLTMGFVVAGHSILVYLIAYISNPSYMEAAFTGFTKTIFYFGIFIVQTFFVMSGWLVSVQMLTMIDSLKQLKLHQCFLICIYRMLRLLPLLAIVVLTHKTSLVLRMFYGTRSHLIENDYKVCQKSWLKSIFFLANLDYQGDMCNMGTWYLAVDTQLFIIYVFVFFLINKFNLGLKWLGLCFCLSLVPQALQAFWYDLDVTYRFFPEEIKLNLVLWSDILYKMYFSTPPHAPTFSMGVLFGAFYYRYRNRPVFDSKVMKLSWILCFGLLPLVIIHLSTFEYEGPVKLFMSTAMKPLFAFGICYGMLGMAFNVGGAIQSFFESKVLETVGFTTYSVYLTHLAMIVGQFAVKTTVIEFSLKNLILSVIWDLSRSFVIGFIAYLCIEKPFSNLQRLIFSNYLPKVKQS